MASLSTIIIRSFAASILVIMFMDSILNKPSAMSPASSSSMLVGVAGHPHHMHIHHHHKHVHEHKHKMLLKHKHKHEHDAKLAHKHDHHHHKKHHKHEHNEHDYEHGHHEHFDSDTGRRPGRRSQSRNNREDKFDMKDFNFLTKSKIIPYMNVDNSDDP